MKTSHTTVDEPMPQSALARIDSVCERFEDAWQAGQRPHIDDYLGDPSVSERDRLLQELIALDIDYRRQLGEKPEAREYQERFPSVNGSWLERLAGSSRYELAGEIGGGGMGTVLQGYDRHMRRDLAVKMLRPEYRDQPYYIRRFLREAWIGARLQHPGIVPVYELGEFANRQQFFTMKLVRGRTLAALLKERANPAQEQPRLLTIFEQVCQTMAYAHAQGVIHRDLKPANIMVGEFGEVQVMDWGLAKVLDWAWENGTALVAGRDSGVATRTLESTDPGMETQPGQALGTFPYMPPEQARGEVDRLDERSDVFGLGAILCEILIGEPPFRGASTMAVLDSAKACDHREALAQLDDCGMDAELLRLTKGCLAAEPADRPRNAGVVAEAVKAYLAKIQELLQTAERERAAAQARAEEARKTAAAERRARWRMVGAALAVVLLLLGTGYGAWYLRQRTQTADDDTVSTLRESTRLLEHAKRSPLAGGGKFVEALEAARKAKQIADTAGASAEVKQQAAERVAELEREVEAADRDRRLLGRLLDIHGTQQGPMYRRDDKEARKDLADPTAEDQFASAFRAWGLDVDVTSTREAANRLKDRPPAVVLEIIAALDEWMSERRRQGKPRAEWQRLADLSMALDDDPNSKRRELREFLTRDRLPIHDVLGLLSAAWRPVPAPLFRVFADGAALLTAALRRSPVPVLVPLGADHIRLRRLAEKTDPATESVLGLLTLTRALRVADESALAERLLRSAVLARPQEVALLNTLGQFLEHQHPPRWHEAVEFYRTARGLRPELGGSLANALLHDGRDAEGQALLQRLIEGKPDNPFLLVILSNVLDKRKNLDGAIDCLHKAIRIDPRYATAYNNLGLLLAKKGDLNGATDCYRKASAVDPTYALAQNNYGIALHYYKNDVDGAIPYYRKAIALDPQYANAHRNLGDALRGKGDLDGALACFRRAIALDPPGGGKTHYYLGFVLYAKGNRDNAIACYKEALALNVPKSMPNLSGFDHILRGEGNLDCGIAYFKAILALNPKDAFARFNLGLALSRKGDALYAKDDRDGAIACYKSVLTLNPKDVQAHFKLGNTLNVKRDWDGAIACFRTVLTLKPKSASAHNNLGNALRGKGQLEEAIAEYSKAIELDPKLAVTYFNFGEALRVKGRLDEAIAKYTEAIRLKKDYAEAHCNLGQVLERKGRFAEALEHRRRGHELGSRSPNWRYPSAQWVRQCERLIELERKLPAILRGETEPADVRERLGFADLCQRYKRLHATSARFYADAFTADPKLAVDSQQQHLYNAACSAALAAAGQGDDARLLPDKVAVMFRRWALIWLRDALTTYGEITQQSNPSRRRMVQQRLAHWQRDHDLSGLRDKDAVDQLPQAERDVCRKLWADVDALLKRTQESR